MTEFPDILVQIHEQRIVLFKFQNHGGIDCNPVVCFCLRILKNVHVTLWVNGFEILSHKLQGLLSNTNSTLIMWSQLILFLFMVPFTIGLDFLFVTFLFHFFLSLASSLSISSFAISASTLSTMPFLRLAMA